MGWLRPAFYRGIAACAAQLLQLHSECQSADEHTLFRNATALQIVLSFPMLGFSYFVNLEIAFAIWFFNLLARAYKKVSLAFWASLSTQKLYYAASFPVLAHQGMGAMLVLAIFGLWTAKPHLADVWRKAIKGDPSIDDSDEMLSYCTAVFGLLISNLFIFGWLWLAGMAWWVLPIYLSAMYLLFIAVTRVVAEGGIAAARAPLIASDFVTSGLGNTVLGPHTLTALGFTFVWAADIRTFVLASCANGLKLAEDTLGRHKRSLFGAIALSILISMGTSIVTVLYLSYEYGGINLNGWFFGPTGGPVYPFNFISGHLNDPQGPNITGWISTLSGGTVMGLLMLARQHFFMVAAPSFGFCREHHFDDQLYFLQRILSLAYQEPNFALWGPTLFQRARPFFLGLILGQFAVAGFWLIVDFFTGMTDNNIYWV